MEATNKAQGNYSDRTTKQDQPSIIGHGDGGGDNIEGKS